jgi:4-diphosphocytidyl-2C-methyl-D-erythritol kinase
MIVSFLEAGEVQGVAHSLYNRLEEAVFPAHADLAGLKEGLVGCGAMGALLSGSGSAVFGLFAEEVCGQNLGSRLEAPARTGPLRVEMVRPTARGWEGIKEKFGSAS